MAIAPLARQSVVVIYRPVRIPGPSLKRRHITLAGCRPGSNQPNRQGTFHSSSLGAGQLFQDLVGNIKVGVDVLHVFVVFER